MIILLKKTSVLKIFHILEFVLYVLQNILRIINNKMYLRFRYILFFHNDVIRNKYFVKKKRIYKLSNDYRLKNIITFFKLFLLIFRNLLNFRLS